MSTRQQASKILQSAIVELFDLAKEDLAKPTNGAAEGFNLMSVISEVRGIYAGISGPAEAAHDPAPTNGVVQPIDSRGSEMFRFEVRGLDLVRIGKKANGGVYEQTVDRARYDEIVQGFASVLQRNPRGKVQATQVKDEVDNSISYYQVNLVSGLLRDRGLARACADQPAKLKEEAAKLWDSIKNQ